MASGLSVRFRRHGPLATIPHPMTMAYVSHVASLTFSISEHMVMSGGIEMISQTGKYALTVLGYLAERRGTWIQGSQIASDTGIPQNYLSKILNQLRKRGFVLSQKGWGGGFQLRPQAASFPIQEVLVVFEGPRDEGQCIFGFRQCDVKNPCALHGYWETIQNSYQEMMSGVTVADLHTGGKK